MVKIMGKAKNDAPSRQRKPNIFVFGRISKPTSYVIDRIRRRISMMLTDDFNFYSIEDGLFPQKIDIFHSKGWRICLWFYRAFKLRNPKMKHVCTFYALPLDKKTGKKLVKASDIITTVSFTTMVEALHAFGNADYRVIYDAVDTNFYRPESNRKKIGRVRVLMVISGARYLKNYMTFLRMAEYFPDVEFVLHTFSPVKTTLPNVVIDNKKYPISNEFGDCEGLRDLYNSADIYLFPSIHEGLNNTILEAMACGLPIVAFNVSSMPELIEHGKNGFLCNSIREMENHLSYLIEDENARKEMGKKSREIASWFSWERCANGYKEIYEELTR